SPHLSFVVRLSFALPLASVGPSHSHLLPFSLASPALATRRGKMQRPRRKVFELCTIPLDDHSGGNENGGGSADPPLPIHPPSHRVPLPLVCSAPDFIRLLRRADRILRRQLVS
ncbi:uncharacterized protein SCHCODRAFT_02490318, partial [Schizophyllum commune H4-8]|uniref:uncharacterized protein n=1 Tax=Schizophyllum commune (strain H4-8 / FGSC 9210) TaxID=578458 RepID=UPI00215E2D5D